jgi:hypothetical protein
VSGVRQQRHGIAHQAVERFDQDESEIKRDADREGRAKARRRMDMRAAMSMSIMVVRMARVIVRHSIPFSLIRVHPLAA